MLQNVKNEAKDLNVTHGRSFLTRINNDSIKRFAFTASTRMVGILVNVTDQKNLQIALNTSAEISEGSVLIAQ